MRNITDEMFTDKFFGELSFQCRLLWIGLLLIADDQGRMEDNAAIIRIKIFPYDEKLSVKEVENGLSIFAKTHKIDRYVSGSNGNGKNLIQIINWWKYQKSTMWAARSIYPSPPKWVDRIRTHDKGSSDIVSENWEHLGGYVATMKELRNLSYVAPTNGQHKSNVADKPETRNLKPKTRNQKPEIKNQPSPLPPSSTKRSSSGRKAGEKDEKKKDLSPILFKDLKGIQLRRAQQVHKILGSLGIRNPKLESTSVILATRHYKNNEQMINEMFGAIASAYADPDVKSKEAVTIHRIEEGKIPQSFIDDRKLWRSVPVKTLELAHIDIDSDERNKYQKSIDQFSGKEA